MSVPDAVPPSSGVHQHGLKQGSLLLSIYGYAPYPGKMLNNNEGVQNGLILLAAECLYLACFLKTMGHEVFENVYIIVSDPLFPTKMKIVELCV